MDPSFLVLSCTLEVITIFSYCLKDGKLVVSKETFSKG